MRRVLLPPQSKRRDCFVTSLRFVPRSDKKEVSLRNPFPDEVKRRRVFCVFLSLRNPFPDEVRRECLSFFSCHCEGVHLLFTTEAISPLRRRSLAETARSDRRMERRDRHASLKAEARDDKVGCHCAILSLTKSGGRVFHGRSNPSFNVPTPSLRRSAFVVHD